MVSTERHDKRLCRMVLNCQCWCPECKDKEHDPATDQVVALVNESRKRPRGVSDEVRLAGIREVFAAARTWHEATNLWSVEADLTWLLERAEEASRAAE